MANDQKLPDIRADVIKKAREAKGISIPQMSKDLCFSVKQIEQIEWTGKLQKAEFSIATASTQILATNGRQINAWLAFATFVS